MGIIEELVIELGIDSGPLERGNEEVNSFLQQAKESWAKNSAELEKFGKDVGFAFGTIERSILGFFEAWLSFQGFKKIITDATDAAAALGHLAHVMNVPVEILSKWTGVIRTVKGDEAAFAGVLRRMATDIANWRITGHEPAWVKTVAALGVLSQAKDNVEIILEMSEEIHKRGLTGPQAQVYLGPLGITDPATIDLLMKGRVELEKLLKEQEKLGPLTERDVKPATELQKVYGEFVTALMRARADITNMLNPAMITLYETATKIAVAGHNITFTFERIRNIIFDIVNGISRFFGWPTIGVPGVGAVGGTEAALVGGGRGRLLRRTSPGGTARALTGGGRGRILRRTSPGEEKGIGPRTEVPGREPASIRYNNPGAQYPAGWAKAYGMQGYGVIGGGHLIARFPTPEAGAAANMALLDRKYAGMTIGAAGAEWTGYSSFGVPGYDPNRVLTHEMVRDPNFVIPFMKAIARREAGRESPLSDEQWHTAFSYFQAGGAPSGIAAGRSGPPIATGAITAVGGGPPAAFIMHHTGGGGTIEELQATLKRRGLGVEYAMDREGRIFQIGGPGAANIMPGWGPLGAGLSNKNIVGMEVIARNNEDVTAAQVAAAQKFIAENYPNTPVFGHGEVNPGHKEADEGMKIVNAIRAQRAKERIQQEREGVASEGIIQSWKSVADALKPWNEKAPAIPYVGVGANMNMTSTMNRNINSEVHVQTLEVHTTAVDASGIAKDIHRELDRQHTTAAAD